MKNFGLILIFLGIAGAFMSLTMDTTVSVPSKTYGEGEYKITTPESRVNNLGLMNDKQNFLIFSGILAVVGALLFVFSSPGNKPEEHYVKQSEENDKFYITKCLSCEAEVEITSGECLSGKWVCPECSSINKVDYSKIV